MKELIVFIVIVGIIWAIIVYIHAPLVVLRKDAPCSEYVRIVTDSSQRSDLDDIFYGENRLSNAYEMQAHKDMCKPVLRMLQYPDQCPDEDWNQWRITLRCGTETEEFT